MRSVQCGWCGHCGAGCAVMRPPYSIPHFYTYWHTCISLIAFTILVSTSVSRGGNPTPRRFRREDSSSQPGRHATTATRALRAYESSRHQAHQISTCSHQVHTWPTFDHGQSWHRWNGLSKEMNILGAQPLNQSLCACSDFCATVFAAIQASNASISA